MSEHDSISNQPHNPDGAADMVAVIAIITIIVATVVYWLSGMN